MMVVKNVELHDILIQLNLTYHLSTRYPLVKLDEITMKRQV